MPSYTVHQIRTGGCPISLRSAIHLGTLLCLGLGALHAERLRAETPRSAYIFPAGMQRGTTATVRVGGGFLHTGTNFELFGAGLSQQAALRATETVWFEDPIMIIPAATGGDDRPRDYLVDLKIPSSASLGLRHWRLWNSQGATLSRPFIIGEFPEVVEAEIPGRPIPTEVKPPLTINGRIFPSEDVDVWQFPARQGEPWLLSVCAAEISSPLRARLQLFDPSGTRISITHGGAERDPQIQFTASQTGLYEVRIDDVRLSHTVADGAFRRPPPQSNVYRLTLARQWQVEGVYPLGGRRGAPLSLQLLGDELPATPVSLTIPQTAGEKWSRRFELAGRRTHEIMLDVSDLPEFLEREPNDTVSRAEWVAWPAVINGRIEKPGDVDCFRISLKPGEPCDFELRSSRLGSPLEGVLSLADSQGHELLRDESLSDDPNDPGLRFSAPRAGDYSIQVSSRLVSRGGPAHAYRLYVRPAESDFQLRLSKDALTEVRELPPPVTNKKKTRREREAAQLARLKVSALVPAPLSVPIQLEISGLPPGITAHDLQIPAGKLDTEIEFEAEQNIRIQSMPLTVQGTAHLRAGIVSRSAVYEPRWNQPAVETVRLAVGLPTPYVIRGATDYSQSPRGTIFRWQYLIDRKGYDGPIEIRMSDSQPRILQGLSGPVQMVPAGETFFTYPAYFAPWMAAGRATRAAVMGTATVSDADGSRHVVSYSAEDPRSQIYLLVTAGPYSLELAEPTVMARVGETIDVPIRIRRESSFRSPVQLTLQVPQHMRGISAVPVQVPANGTTATLKVQFSDPLGPLNTPVVVHAASTDLADPLEAQAELELVNAP